MKTIISNEIIVNEPSVDLRKWCAENLVYDNPDYYKKARMGFWVGRTPKTLQTYKVNNMNLYLPFGTLSKVWKMIKNCPYKVDFKATKIYPVSYFRLYDYQEKAVEALLKAKNGIVISKAGSGKGVFMLELICRLGYKALWINSKTDLMNQAYDRAEANIKNVTLGKITGGKINIGDITFATVQTLSNIDLQQYKHEWAVIVVDEVQGVCNTPTKYTQFSKVLSNLAARFKFGCTATLHRSDGLEKTACDLIGDVVYEVPEEEIADKIIKAKIQPIITTYEPSSDTYNADGTISSFSNLISDLCGNYKRNTEIVKILKENEGHSCIVLSDRVGHLKELQKAFGKGIVIDGTMTTVKKRAERREALEKMKAGKEKVLFASYALAKEGLDIPRLDRLIMATPKKDLTVVIQSVGRIERVYEGTEEPIVHDFVDEKEEMLRRMFVARKRIYKKNSNIILQ